MECVVIGRYIVADHSVCHGQPSFRGTHVPVRQVFEQLAEETAWETVVEHSAGDVTREAIAEAVRVAGAALIERLSDGRVTGRFVVADPGICHGQPTFRGTRVFVADVVDQLAREQWWDSISRSWNGSVTREAIAEVLHLAGSVLTDGEQAATDGQPSV